jgi:FixJ family two-component response regulator
MATDSLLITDSAMPAMSGLELVERILAIRPSMPVLMVRGEDEAISAEALRVPGGVPVFCQSPTTRRLLRPWSRISSHRAKSRRHLEA